MDCTGTSAKGMFQVGVHSRAADHPYLSSGSDRSLWYWMKVVVVDHPLLTQHRMKGH